MGRGLVDARVAGGELGPAEDVAAADDDGDLRPVLGGAVGLPGDVQHGVHGDAALAGMQKPSPEIFNTTPAGTAETVGRRLRSGHAAYSLRQFPVDEPNQLHARFLGHLADRLALVLRP